MSTSSKWIIAIIVILAIVGGVWWYMSMGGASGAYPASTAPVSGSDQSSQTAAASNGTLTTSPSDTSDASLNADMSSIDSGMNGLNADASAAANAPTN